MQENLRHKCPKTPGNWRQPWVLVFIYRSDLFDFLCFRYNASTELGAIMRTDFVSCVSVLRVASGAHTSRKHAYIIWPP